MSKVVIDGITTRYEVVGEGQPLLMFSPGGFDSSLDSWRTVGIYPRIRLVEHLSRRFTCVLFDRRESGQSGGRAERLSWSSYVDQAVGLLDHLNVETAHLIGACVGCSSAASLAVMHPGRVLSMVLYSPAGGVHYRRKQHERFTIHSAFVAEQGLRAVVELARSGDDGFSKDPRVGPWAAAIRTDDAFAEDYSRLDPGRYQVILTGSVRLLFDRDTVPGLEPEDLMLSAVPALIVPGRDSSHAPSAAQYLQECLPAAETWDVPPAEQTEDTAPPRIIEFLTQHNP